MTNRPIFIVGSPRSGTSVLTWCIGQHSNIQFLEETHWIARLGVRLREVWELGACNQSHSHLGSLGWKEEDFYQKIGQKLNEMIVQALSDQVFFRINESSRSMNLEPIDESFRYDINKLFSSDDPSSKLKIIRSPQDPKKRWVDGTPENTFYAYTLLRLFPQARFIHLIRKPDNVAASLMNFGSVGGAAISYSHEDSYNAWLRYTSHAHLLEKALGQDYVYRVNYENLIDYPAMTINSILNWIEEDYENICLEPLAVKINSSKVDRLETITSPTRQNALNIYSKILQSTVQAPDPTAMQELLRINEEMMQDFASNRPSSGVKVENWGPRETPEGVKFNTQPNGVSAIWVKVKGVSKHPKTHVLFGRNEISGQDKDVQNEAVVFIVRDELIQKSGSYEVAIIEGDTGMKIEVGDFKVKPAQ